MVRVRKGLNKQNTKNHKRRGCVKQDRKQMRAAYGLKNFSKNLKAVFDYNLKQSHTDYNKLLDT